MGIQTEAVIDLPIHVRQVIERERFLHWELAFPTVWRELDRRDGRGGSTPSWATRPGTA